MGAESLEPAVATLVSRTAEFHSTAGLLVSHASRSCDCAIGEIGAGARDTGHSGWQPPGQMT